MHQLRKTIYLADDHPLVLEGMRKCIQPMQGLEVIGASDNAHQATADIRKLKPDLSLLDLDMPGQNAFRIIEKLHEQDRHLRLAIISIHHDPVLVRKARQIGAMGYLPKQISTAQLQEAIMQMISGQPCFSAMAELPEPAKAQPAHQTSQHQLVALAQLNQQQQQLLILLTEGKTPHEMATAVGIHQQIIQRQMVQIQQIIGANSQADLIRFALRSGLAG